MNSPLLRFAPSPTGYLHVGNARVAIMNALLASQLGGAFMLRIDDTDTERSSETYTQAIREDLRWLGLEWQREEKQSQRLKIYQQALQYLIEHGRAYACYDTPEELSLMRKTALGAGRPPIYDRHALSLTEAEKKALESEGRRPHWRFKLDHDQSIEWYDMARAEVKFEAANLSDPVLFREDGRALYTITSVVDDGDMGVSHVLRGEDHVSNTATQIQLFTALGYAVPQFAHLPLLVGADAKPLSKRYASSSVRGLRDSLGLEGESVSAFLVALGTSNAAEPIKTLADLVEGFDLSAYGKASPRFEEEALLSLNARQLQASDLAKVKARLGEMGVGEKQKEGFWAAIRGNIAVLKEAHFWWTIVAQDIAAPEMPAEDVQYCHIAADLVNKNFLKTNGYKAWVAELKQQTGRKGKALFMPLRIALSGVSHGPELDQLLLLMGLEQAKKRLRQVKESR